MSDTSTSGELRRTALYDFHQRHGARLVPFAGYELPVQYAGGIIREHLHTRSQAGLFDVSHMGQIRVEGADAASALESLTPADILSLAPGRQRYALLTNEAGGIVDDIMVINTGNALLLVVNAACKERDLQHLQDRIGARCGITPLFEERALLALQGPAAVEVLGKLAPAVHESRFMEWRRIDLAGVECWISRTGYTGEDGFEISIPSADAVRLAERLASDPAVQPVGLGARDSLRLEAGLSLYGQDIDETTTPVPAGLGWTIGKPRRRDGERAGGFPGAARILEELEASRPEQTLVGLLPDGKAPVRAGAAVMYAAGNTVGRISSGGFSPSLNRPVAMGYVATAARTAGGLFAEVRNRRISLQLTARPFVPHRYVR